MTLKFHKTEEYLPVIKESSSNELLLTNDGTYHAIGFLVNIRDRLFFNTNTGKWSINSFSHWCFI